MARMPSIQRLAAEDFPGQPWITRLLSPLNTFMTEVVAALNKGITFGENMNCQISTVTATGAVTFTPVEFKSTIGRPTGLVLLNQLDTSDTPTTNSAAVGLDWSYDFASGLITLNNVPGLTVGVTYNLTYLVIGS